MNKWKIAARRRAFRQMGLDYDAIKENERRAREYQRAKTYTKGDVPRYYKLPERLSEQNK